MKIFLRILVVIFIFLGLCFLFKPLSEHLSSRYYCESLFGLGDSVDVCKADHRNIILKMIEEDKQEFDQRIKVVEGGLLVIKWFFVLVSGVLSAAIFMFFCVFKKKGVKND